MFLKSTVLTRRVPKSLLYVSPVFSPNFAHTEKDGGFSCLCTGSENLFVGTKDGFVRILSRAFKVIRSFKAHDVGSITHMKQIEGTALLVTVAEDLLNEPSLKVWALDKLEKRTESPRCQSSLSVQNGRKQFPVCRKRDGDLCND